MSIAPFTRGMARDFVTLRDAMDRLFEESVVPSNGEGLVGFAADLYEEGDGFVLKASLPGIRRDEIQIEATANGITISGEYKRDDETKDGVYLRRERRYGRFQRTFELPVEIDPANAEASFEDGVLTVKLPKSEHVKPKQIKVTPSASLPSGNGRTKTATTGMATETGNGGTKATAQTAR